MELSISHTSVRRISKEETMRILFSDEKPFDIDGVYHSQND